MRDADVARHHRHVTPITRWTIPQSSKILPKIPLISVVLEPYRKRLKRCVGCMSEFLHDPPDFVISKREQHTYFYAGRRCLSWRKMFYHYRTSCIIRRHPDFDILSAISNSSDISRCVCVCVCLCVRACGIKETFVHLKCVLIFFEFYTPMHAPIHRSGQCHQ